MVSNSAPKKLAEFPSAGEKVKFSNFISWFHLKDKLLEQKIDTTVSCPDTEGPWKVCGKIDSWVPIQPTKKSANFVPASQKVENSNFMGLFCLKGTLIQAKTVKGISSCDTEGPWKVWGKTYSRFPIQPRKDSTNFIEAGKKGQNFKIYGIVLSKRYIGSVKNCSRSFIL